MNSLPENLHTEDFSEQTLVSNMNKLSINDALECDIQDGCRYEVTDQLHCGPNSKVYLVNMRWSPTSAISTEEVEEVQGAVKLVNGGLFTYLLDREYRILNTLNHPNIIKPLRYQYSCNSDGKTSSLLAVPYYKRGDLFEAVKSRDGLGETKSLRYFKQIASALEYVHEANIAHRDIKLENMVIDDNSNAKLIDFGFAFTSEVGSEKDIQTQIFEESAESQIEGTVGYMAPELRQACLENSLDNSICSERWEDRLEKYKAGDVFALGVTLFTMVVGSAPFTSASKTDINYRTLEMSIKRPGASKFWTRHPKAKKLMQKGDLSAEFRSLIQSMLNPVPEDRIRISSVLNHPWIQKSSNFTVEELKLESE